MLKGSLGTNNSFFYNTHKPLNNYINDTTIAATIKYSGYLTTPRLKISSPRNI